MYVTNRSENIMINFHPIRLFRECIPKTRAKTTPKSICSNSPLLYKSIKGGDFYQKTVTTLANTEYEQTNRSILRLLETGSYPDTFFESSELAGKDILDVGTGGGQFVLDMRRLGAKAVGIDIAPHPNFKKHPNFFKLADAIDTKFPDKSFDRIYSSWSIFSFNKDCLDFQVKALKELGRILKDDGRIRLGMVTPESIRQIVKNVDGLVMVEDSVTQLDLGMGWVELIKKMEKVQ